MQARCACSSCSRRKLEAVRARASDAEAVVIFVFSCGDRAEAVKFVEYFGDGVGIGSEELGNWAVGSREGDGLRLIGLKDHNCTETGECCELCGCRNTGAQHEASIS